MALTMVDGWAPPVIWGPWVKLVGWSNGIITRELQFDSLSEATSTFDVELEYYIGNLKKTETFIGPGTHSYGFGMCFCVSKLRMRSHALGQAVRITIRD